MTTMPPEPMMAPAGRPGLVVDRRVEQVRREAAAGGTADLHGLELPAGRHAAADVEDDLPQRDAHGHLDQAAVDDLAGEGKTLVPLLVSVPSAANPPRRC